MGYLERVTTLREEAEALLEQPVEDRRAAANLLLSLGMLALIPLDHARVVFRAGESLALFREEEDLRSCAQCFTIMGISALAQGDIEQAARAFEEDLRLLRQFRDKIGTIVGLLGIAGVAVLRDQPARAARLFGAADALLKAIGHSVMPLTHVIYDYEGYLATARGTLGETAFEAAWAEGRTMSPEQAIEYGLSAEEPAQPSSSVPEESPSALTRREQEVALLVARGFTNRQIASELAISGNTVANHVAQISRKLNVPSRLGIAVWVTQRSLRDPE